jgi:sugar lactone lactonase YvrE
MFTTTLSSSAHSCEAKRKNSRSVAAIMFLALCCLALLASSPLQAQNTINTVAGGAAPATVATQADLPGPAVAVEDASGNLYISAPYTYYIYKVTPAGALSVYAGIGIFAGGGDNGPATKAGLAGVLALALDSKGDLYLADKGNNNVRCILAVTGGCGGSTASVGDIVEVVNANGKTCYPVTAACGDGGPAINAQISYPEGLFIDSSDNLWISDTYDYRIRCVVGTSGGCDANFFYGSPLPVGDILTVAGTGQFCDGPAFDCGNNGPALQAFFDLPSGIAVDTSGNFYIADTRDFTVRCVLVVSGGCGGSTESVGNIIIFAGTGDPCLKKTNGCGNGGPANKALLWNPSGLAFDKTGSLYIADTVDNQIRCVVGGTRGCLGSPLPVGDITTVAGDGNQGFYGDGGKARSGWLNLPNGVFINSAGNVLIADTGNQRIREVASAKINTIAGGGADGNGGAATSATLANPNAMAWDTFGDYYITDAANNQVRVVTPSGNIYAFAGTGIAGPPNTSPVVAANATLNNPNGIAIDANNNVYIADTGNQVIRCVLAVSGGCGSSTAAVGDIITVAGDGNSCVPNNGACGDGGSAINGELTGPTSVAIDSKGNLYIADSQAHRVRQVNMAAGIINNTAGTGVKCGAIASCGNGGPANKAKLGRAYGVAVDSSGNVYIADSGDNQIRCVVEVSGGCGGSTSPVGDIVAFAFNGKARFAGDGGLAINASMDDPLEVSVDSSNNVFVGGGGDNLVRRIDAASLTIETVAGNPLHPQTSGYSGDGGPCTQATLDNVGFAVDSKGDLVIADAGNNRVRECTLAAEATLSKKQLTFPTEPIGQSSAPMPVTFKNAGYVDLPISGEQIQGLDAGDFSINNNTCGSQLAPGSSCSISVVFTPTKAGKRTAKLEINDSLGQQTVALVGTGQ